MKVNKKSVQHLLLGGLLTIGVVIGLAAGSYFFYFRHLTRLEIYARHHGEIQFIKKLSNVLFVPQLFTPEKLPRYDLIVKRQDLEFLNSNLPAGYVGALLSDQNRQSVPATFLSGSEVRKVEVRYRGDTDIHWRDPQKSWRVNFPVEEPFDGSSAINLIIPVDRGYLLESLNFYRAKKLGLLVPEIKFVNLFVNGARHGVYWQVEQWGPEFLARNGIATSTNLYGSAEFADLEGLPSGGFSTASAWRKYASKADGIDDYSDLQRLLDVINLPSDEALNEQIGTVIDFDNFYAWQINQYLTMSDHQSGINLRLYPDPTTGKFRFLPWDIMMGDPLPPYVEANYNQLITRILSNRAFLHERNLRLWQYVGDEATLADDLAYYDQLDGQTRGDFYKDSLKVESNLAYRRKIRTLRQQIVDRVKALRDNLNYANATFSNFQKIDDTHASFDLTTSGFSAIKLVGITIDTECDSRWTIARQPNGDDVVNLIPCSDETRLHNTDKLSFLVYSDKMVDGDFLRLASSTERFILTTNRTLSQQFLNDKQIKFTVINAVTGETVEPIFN
ncbi:MAG: hypothetical protein A3J59_02355 [Candidatus Buchananbacteria bacterium RIFCSPHIGHO2_02_FULL_56_16]|uniref:Spore coat protein CotH n=1 Tax=Candidatus Buchananbacteria bacterium RIFCSPHIGHO2_02_FULL_56_16 TaxID=1797542 RepID=A0A1G1YG71_9BACT|nr:MAG: hypothetical protein A3J59_02355 [Candidatus Buchananbacteria bacterium RIFCSPHIGHO2_02_FULL_56_16]